MKDRCQYRVLEVQCLGENGHEGPHDFDADALKAAADSGAIIDTEVISKQDELTKVSTAQFKRWRRKITTDLNAVIQSFQRDQVSGQGKLNLAWNVMNVFIRILIDKGLITQEEMQTVGSTLMAEMRENIEKMKAGERDKIKPTPMEEAKKAIFRE